MKLATADVPVFDVEINRMPWTANATTTARGPTAQRTPADPDGAADTAAHLDRVRRLLHAEREAARRPRRRGAHGQYAKRGVQAEVRQQAVVCYQRLHAQGTSLEAVAKLLALNPRTLRHWIATSGSGHTPALPLGRPTARAARDERQQVLACLQEQGPGVGVPTLHRRFPTLARAELADLLGRYRRVLAARAATSARVLHWLVPGRVWAIDFAQPSWTGGAGRLPPIDGRYPYVVAVRDLASGYQLAWVPVSEATAATTCAVLAGLFAVHGAPLVLKADNGPPFRAHQTKAFLAEAGVHFLFSPPYWPGYNGAIEASIGSLKTRTEQHAAGQGHAGLWTWADLDAARHQANTSRPRRLHGQTPAQAWARRTAVTTVERVRFELAVERNRYLVRHDLNLDQATELDHWQGSALDRKAFERALVEHDYLLFRGRRLPLTIKPGKVTFFV